jgi:hypothetical protein
MQRFTLVFCKYILVYLSVNQADINKLLGFAKNIEAFRLERKKLHPVENIVFITILAIICNAVDWEEVADFGTSRKASLSLYIFGFNKWNPLSRYFQSVFSLFSPEKFQYLFIGWLHELLDIKIESDNQVVIDGKK